VPAVTGRIRAVGGRARRRLASLGRPSDHSQRIADNTQHLLDIDEHVTKLYHHHLDVNHRVHVLEEENAAVRQSVADFERHLPAVLNAIASANGTGRLLRREIAALEQRVRDLVTDHQRSIDQSLQELGGTVARDTERIDGHIREELWPLIERVGGLETHTDTLAFLLRRVETVRAEMLHELRYGRDPAQAKPVVEIVNETAWKQALDTGVRFNLGCGHIPLEGFINVDVRKLPDVDVVAPIDELPVGPESVEEIFSAHTLEHFPANDLERRLMPYWVSLLRPGGVFRAVVPDHDAMVAQYGRGEIEFVTLREVTFGGQEYEGDFHYNAFTPETLEGLLRGAGLDDVELIARGRPNGDCLEFEMSARRPT
jgi:hypothetical protein